MEDLLGRGRQIGIGIVDGLPAAGRLKALDEGHALDIGEEQRLAQDGRHRVEAAGDLRVERLADELSSSIWDRFSICQSVIASVASPSTSDSRAIPGRAPRLR